jgi:hypothetical protein
MFQNIMHRMEGISGYGLFSICLFFLFFAGMLLWAAWLKRDYLKSMSQLPLDSAEKGQDAEVPTSHSLTSHE